MFTGEKRMDEKTRVKRYKVQHSIDDYTFPAEAYIHSVKIDGKYIHVELTDQRILSIPLWWIPTVYSADAENRNKFEINQSRTMIIWDPAKCSINDEISIADYLAPSREKTKAIYAARQPKRQIAESKAKTRK